MSQPLPRYRPVTDTERRTVDKIVGEDPVVITDPPKRKRRKRPPLPPEVRQLVIDRDGTSCYLCGLQCYEHEIHIDHVIPRSRGGSDDPSNLKVACWLCNMRKGAKIENAPARVRIRVDRGVPRDQIPSSAFDDAARREYQQRRLDRIHWKKRGVKW